MKYEQTTSSAMKVMFVNDIWHERAGNASAQTVINFLYSENLLVCILSNASRFPSTFIHKHQKHASHYRIGFDFSKIIFNCEIGLLKKAIVAIKDTFTNNPI